MGKTCKRCKSTRENTDFYADRRIKGGRASICKDCKRKDNKDVYGRVKDRRGKNTGLCIAYINDVKKCGCGFCGEKTIVCLQFHHADPGTKLFTIATRRGFDAKLVAEISKCVILCANCHFKFHADLIDISHIPLICPPTLEDWLNERNR